MTSDSSRNETGETDAAYVSKDDGHEVGEFHETGSLVARIPSDQFGLKTRRFF
jgi:hypothetical protein